MNPPEPQRVKEEFSRRRRFHRTRAILMVVVFAAFAAVVSRSGGFSSTIGVLLFVGIMGVFALSLKRKARCPACDGDLSRNMNMSSCPRCGAALR